jgi:hypothetical protein
MPDSTVDRSLVYEPGLFRVSEAWSALVLCATAGFIVSMAIGTPGAYITAPLAAATAGWSIRRAFRIRLAVDRNGVTVHNYWQTHRLAWAEVAGVGISLKGILPRPALAFSLRTGGAVFAQAIPLRQTERRNFQTAVLAFAPASVRSLRDTAGVIGSDKALSNQLRLWWRRRHNT